MPQSPLHPVPHDRTTDRASDHEPDPGRTGLTVQDVHDEQVDTEPPPPAEVTLPAISEVDAPLRAAPAGNGGTGSPQDSVDHMFRLFSRRGR